MVEVRIPVILEGVFKNAKQIADSIASQMQASFKTVQAGAFSSSGAGIVESLRAQLKSAGDVVERAKTPSSLDAALKEQARLQEELNKTLRSDSTSLAKEMNRGFNSMIAKVGVLAALWEAFDVFLRPIMTLFKIIMLLLLMPLMPLLKTMLTHMTELAKKVGSAQKEAGGEGLGAFSAGFGAILSDPMVLALSGGLLAAGFLAGLTGASVGAVLAGAFLAAIGGAVVWDKITVGSENSLSEKLLGTGLMAGIAMGVAKLVFGKPWGATLNIGVAALGVGLAFDFFSTVWDVFKNGGSVKKYFEMLMFGTASGAAIGALIGGPVGALWGAAIGASLSIVFTLGSVFLKSDFGQKIKDKADELVVKPLGTLSNVLRLGYARWSGDKLAEYNILKEMGDSLKPSEDLKNNLDSTMKSASNLGSSVGLSSFNQSLLMAGDSASSLGQSLNLETFNKSLDSASQSASSLNSSLDLSSFNQQLMSSPEYAGVLDIQLKSLDGTLKAVDTSSVLLYSNMNRDVWATNASLLFLNKRLGPNTEKLSLSAVLLGAEIGWLTMMRASVFSINSIVSNLKRIPREIVTVHKIKTVYV